MVKTASKGSVGQSRKFRKYRSVKRNNDEIVGLRFSVNRYSSVLNDANAIIFLALTSCGDVELKSNIHSKTDIYRTLGLSLWKNS